MRPAVSWAQQLRERLPRWSPLARVGAVMAMLGVLTLLVSQVGDWAVLKRTLLSLEPAWVALAFAAYVAATTARGARFYALNAARARFPAMVRIAVQHQAARAVIPAQLGELSYPTLLRRETGRPYGRGVGQLLLVRLLDLNMIALVLVTGSLAQIGVDGRDRAWTAVAFGFLGLALLGVFTIGPALGRVRAGLHLLARRGRRRRRRLRRLARTVGRVRHALEAYPGRTLAVALAATVVAIGFALARVYGLLAAFGIVLAAHDLLLVFGVIHALGLVPIRAFGGFGVKEVGLLSLLMALGYGIEDAAAVTALFALAAVVFPVALAMPTVLIAGDRRVADAE